MIAMVMQHRTYPRACRFLSRSVASIERTIRISATVRSVTRVMFTISRSPILQNHKLFNW